MNPLRLSISAIIVSVALVQSATAQQGNFGSLNVTNNANIGGTVNAGLLRGPLNTQGGAVNTVGGNVQIGGGNINLGFGNIADVAHIFVTGGGGSISMTSPNAAFNTNGYVSAARYIVSAGDTYLGSYQGGYALVISNIDGSVVLKRAQGDISMGIFGN